MSVFKCKMCGGTLEINLGETVGTCEYCGTKQTLPKLDDDRKANMFDRANHFRRNNDYDKAASIYEQILNEDNTDAETYWSLVLCRYGIEYVEDPATHKRIPTVNRAQFTSIFDDADYKSALQYADIYQRSIYEEEANAINEIQKGILAISQKEEPFDVFICYKETDNNGRRTMDSVLANDLYHQLTQEGFKVFFSRITLEDKLGTAYEPYIFAALNSAKVMVVIGTKPEHFSAVWVKNEWSRYLALVKQSNGKKVLIPAYRDMDPYDLPDEFSHLQAQDMSKLGFMQDLIRGIKKITKADEQKAMVKETVVVSNNANIAPLLERAFLFLEDSKWQDANIYCEKVLDIDPKNGEAYLGKLMADLHVRTRDQLADCTEPFDDRENYGKVIRFGNENLESEIRGYIAHINERNENTRLTDIYNSAVNEMNSAGTEVAYKAAAESFKTISGFKDADNLYEQCLLCAEDSKKEEERMHQEAESYADAIAIAINAKDSEKRGSLLQAQLSNKQNTLSELQMLVDKYNDNESEINRLKGKYQYFLERISQMQEKRSSLGIIEGRKKRQLIEEIKKLEIQKDVVEKSIHSYEFEEYVYFLKIYWTNGIIRSIFNVKYPDLTESLKTIEFGEYYKLSRKTKEPIEWLILEVENNRFLLLSKNAIDGWYYNVSNNAVTWETCSLRKWLNETFLNDAFTHEEQNKIAETIVTADKNPSYDTPPGNNTTDRVFLLSITEVNKYFNSDSARRCQATKYAKVYKDSSDENRCWWWLRSPGYDSKCAVVIGTDGIVSERGHSVNGGGGAIRPAMWINLGE